MHRSVLARLPQVRQEELEPQASNVPGVRIDDQPRPIGAVKQRLKEECSIPCCATGSDAGLRRVRRWRAAPNLPTLLRPFP